MKNLNPASLAILVCCLFISCSKSEDKAMPPQTMPELLFNKKWGVASFTATVNGSQTYSVVDLWPACEKDNYSVFKQTGEYILDEGATVCSSTDPQQKTGQWEYDINSKKLIYTLGNNGYRYEWLITAANSSSFSGEYSKSDGVITQDYKITFISK